MKITNQVRSNIMKAAWVYSRQQAAKFGGKPSEYFAMSLKLYWDSAKRQMAKVKAAEARKNVIKLKDWFLAKNGILSAHLKDADATRVSKETEKAMLIEVIEGSYIVYSQWVPKSVVA